MNNLFFDLIDLRLFANIAEAKSLTGGAERSHMSLAAASLRIKNLETALATPLLYRDRTGVTLTPAGQAFLRHALLMLRQGERLHGDLQAFAEGLKGRVRLLANTTAITEFLPAVLGRFLADHPDVDVDLEERLSDDIVHAVGEDSADIGIIAGSVNADGLTVMPYRSDRLVLAVPTSHPLADKTQISFAECLGYEFVSLHAGSAIHSFINEVARRHGTSLALRIKVSSFDALCRMVEARVGIGVLPQSSAMRQQQTTDIALVELTDAWAKRDMKICVRSLEDLPVFAQQLVEYLADEKVHQAGITQTQGKQG